MNPLEKFRLENLDNKKLLVIGIAGLLLVYVDVVYLLGGQIKAVNGIVLKMEKIQGDIRELMALKELKRKEPNLSKEPVSKLKKAINKENIPLIMQDLSKLAVDNGVNITQMKIAGGLTEVLKDTKQARQPKASPKAKVKPESKELVKYDTVIITMELNCSYHQLGRFLSDIERQQTMISVDELKINNDPANYGQQKVELSLLLYVTKN